MKKEKLVDILRNYKNERTSFYGIVTIGNFRSMLAVQIFNTSIIEKNFCGLHDCQLVSLYAA